MNIKRIIPNSFTGANLLCGAIATYLATQYQFTWAFLFILGGAFFDFFDGMSARALKIVNKIGVELDSLADDITFGLAPAMMVACYLKPFIGYWAFIALMMAVFSAIRLANFNIDERQHESFIGLATPANAIFWGGLTCIPQDVLCNNFYGPWIILAFTLVSCYLLNAEIPFFSFKSFKSEKALILCFLAGCLILIGFCLFKALSIKHLELALVSGSACILWYVMLNLLLACIRRPKK